MGEKSLSGGQERSLREWDPLEVEGAARRAFVDGNVTPVIWSGRREVKEGPVLRSATRPLDRVGAEPLLDLQPFEPGLLDGFSQDGLDFRLARLDGSSRNLESGVQKWCAVIGMHEGGKQTGSDAMLDVGDDLALHPARLFVEASSLADASPYLTIDEDRFINVPMMPFVRGLADVIRELPERGVDWAVAALGDLSIGPMPAREIMSDAFLREYVAEAAPMDPDLIASLFSRTARYDVDTVLQQVLCPIRLVHGDVAKGSVVIPEDVVRYRQFCSDFVARYDPNVGHGVHRKPVEQAFRADIESIVALIP